MWGPYKRFPAGRYEAKLTMRVENIKDISAPVAVFDVVSSKGAVVHAKKEIYWKDFPSPGQDNHTHSVGVGFIRPALTGVINVAPTKKKIPMLKYIELVIPLEVKEDVSDIEFRIDYLENADLYTDKIDIIVPTLSF